MTNLLAVRGVSHEMVTSDFIFHESHNHFHFADFASYRLLTKDAQGTYQPSTQEEHQISFCIQGFGPCRGRSQRALYALNRDFQGLNRVGVTPIATAFPINGSCLGDRFLADGDTAWNRRGSAESSQRGGPDPDGQQHGGHLLHSRGGSIVAPRHTAARAGERLHVRPRETRESRHSVA